MLGKQKSKLNSVVGFDHESELRSKRRQTPVSKLIKSIREGNINYSPSYNKEIRSCRRKGIYNFTQSASNPHTKYGHAFGDAMATLFRQINSSTSERLSDEVALGRALVGVVPWLQEFGLEGFKGKGLDTLAFALKNVLFSVRAYAKNYTFDSTEHKTKIKFPFTYKGETLFAHWSGTYDVALRHRESGTLRVLDAKAINSQWGYSFETDPQILFYQFLLELQGKETSPDGEYWIHQIKGEQFEIVPVRPRVYSHFLVRHIEHSIEEAKKLAIFARENYNTSTATELNRNIIEDVDGTLHECNKGGYSCYYTKPCFGDDLRVETYEDDRRPEKIIFLELEEDQIREFAIRVQKRWAKELRIKETVSEELQGTVRKKMSLDADTMQSASDLLDIFDL
jgi:hypothetical protein